jgi:hypothetical protein
MDAAIEKDDDYSAVVHILFDEFMQLNATP